VLVAGVLLLPLREGSIVLLSCLTLVCSGGTGVAVILWVGVGAFLVITFLLHFNLQVKVNYLLFTIKYLPYKLSLPDTADVVINHSQNVFIASQG
jgi:hypothetical protein